jgi:hypothetical protein
MSKFPACLVIAEPPLAEGEVVPLGSTDGGLAPARLADGVQPRETSWRDLVRRLAKNPAKR